jgi:O-antigen/teichoic acid export membrane protein
VGAFSTIFTLFAFTQLLPLLGLHMSLVRDSVKPGEDALRQAADVLAIGLGAALLLGLALGSIGLLLYPPELHLPIWLVAACLPLHACMLVGDSLLIGRERMSLVAFINGGESLLRLAGWIVMALLGWGLVAMSSWMLFARLLAVGVHRMNGGLKGVPVLAPSWSGMSGQLRTVPIFLGIVLAASVIARQDSLLLPLLGGLHASALYAVGFKVYEAALMVPQSVALALYPTIVRHFTRDSTAYVRLISDLLGLVLLLGLPCALLTAAFIGPLIVSLFGPGYADSVPVIQLLIFATVLVAADQIMSSVMIAAHRQRLDLTVLATAGIGGTVLLSVLIPVYGHVGAAAAVLSMLALQVVVRGALLRSIVRLTFSSILLRPLLAAGVMALALVAGQEWHWALQLFAALAGFLLVAWISGILAALHPQRLQAMLRGGVETVPA